MPATAAATPAWHRPQIPYLCPNQLDRGIFTLRFDRPRDQNVLSRSVLIVSLPPVTAPGRRPNSQLIRLPNQCRARTSTAQKPLPAQAVNATPSSALIRQCFRGRTICLAARDQELAG